MSQKVIVAIHGIGEQFTYETIQSVAYQFCKFFEIPPAIPLGKFHKELGGKKAPFFDRSLFPSIGFAEVYWADIPREVVEKKYKLEESKKWAKTIVERIRKRCKDKSGPLSPKDYELMEVVLDEMIDTIAVLERLSLLAEKVGRFKFDLRKLLVNFLGDVQIVTEFGPDRDRILSLFDEVMESIHKQCDKNVEIYIIAHSEGTVISFLGLLRAMSRSDTPVWVKSVKGFMTIGSPIETHLVLWPDLWEPYKRPAWQPRREERIKWRNYYDAGDPIGFKLSKTKEWLDQNGWEAFDIDENNNYEFSRYNFPGKAHVDYWHDPLLFHHFITTVVGEEPKKEFNYDKLRGYKLRPLLSSYVLPYLLVSGLLFVGVYILYKSVIGCMYPDDAELKTVFTSKVILRNVAGITLLLLGITVMTRIPRLIKLWRWRIIGFLFLLASTAGFFLLADKTANELESRFNWLNLSDPTIALVGIIAVLVTLISLLSRRYPSWGPKWLIYLGTASVLAIVSSFVLNDPEKGAIWPVVLASAGFFYLWWLAALVFDLVFVWHRYIRHNAGIENLREVPLEDAYQPVVEIQANL